MPPPLPEHEEAFVKQVAAEVVEKALEPVWRQIDENRQTISRFDRALGVMESVALALQSGIGEIKSDIRDLVVKLSGRPSWAIASLITILSGLVVGLTVALFRR